MKTALTFTIPITTTLHRLFPSLNRVSHLFPVHTKLTKVVKKGLSDGLIDNMSFEKDIPEADIQGKTEAKGTLAIKEPRERWAL